MIIDNPRDVEMSNIHYSDEQIRQSIISHCSCEFLNSDFIFAQFMYDFYIKNIIIGDMYIENVMRKMIAAGDLSSDNRGAYGFYSVSR